jgi:hypothetical protein
MKKIIFLFLFCVGLITNTFAQLPQLAGTNKEALANIARSRGKVYAGYEIVIQNTSLNFANAVNYELLEGESTNHFYIICALIESRLTTVTGLPTITIELNSSSSQDAFISASGFSGATFTNAIQAGYSMFICDNLTLQRGTATNGTGFVYCWAIKVYTQ